MITATTCPDTIPASPLAPVHRTCQRHTVITIITTTTCQRHTTLYRHTRSQRCKDFPTLWSLRVTPIKITVRQHRVTTITVDLQ